MARIYIAEPDSSLIHFFPNIYLYYLNKAFETICRCSWCCTSLCYVC